MEPKIDLLPAEEKKPGINLKNVFSVILVLLIITFLVFSYLHNNYWIRMLETEVGTLNKMLAERVLLQKEYKQLQQEEEELQKQLQQIEKFKDDIDWYSILYELGYLVPEDTYLSSFTYNAHGEFNIQGGSLDYSLIARMLNNLDKSDYFRDISLQRTTTSQESGKEYVVFVIQGAFEGSSDLNVE